MARFTTNVVMLDAVSVDTTSEMVDVSARNKLSLQLTCTDRTTGNGVFTVLVSNDGTNFVAYNRMIPNTTKASPATDDGVASFTLNSNTSVMVFFPVGDHFRYMKVVVDFTTDGKYSAESKV